MKWYFVPYTPLRYVHSIQGRLSFQVAERGPVVLLANCGDTCLARSLRPELAAFILSSVLAAGPTS